MKVVIGSRASKLAVIQSELVMDAIRRLSPEIETELVTMTTTGDQILDRTLDQVGGKGLFVKELDRALLAQQVDITVHSLKDMPMEQHPDLPIRAFTRREDPRDVLVLRAGVSEVPKGGIIGSASLRRVWQLKELYPEAEIRPVRGNLQTRLAKLDSGAYDALVLAAAGLKRSGLEKRISRFFTPEELIPAAGQGVLGVQCRRKADYPFLAELGDKETTLCVLAERSFVRRLNGGCSDPTAAFATLKGDALTLTGFYVPPEGAPIRRTITGNSQNPEQLGICLAEDVLEEKA